MRKQIIRQLWRSIVELEFLMRGNNYYHYYYEYYDLLLSLFFSLDSNWKLKFQNYFEHCLS